MITSVLKVLLWGREVGRLSWDSRRGLSYFEYSQDFLRGGPDAFPLLASIASPASRRPIWGDRETKIYRRLPPFLADSLPDAWGNQVFECWRVEQGIKGGEITPLDLLAFIGRRGMGALEFEPETSGARHDEVLHLQALTDLARRIYRERESVTIHPDESLTMQSLIAVGTSAGGRQPKAIVAIHPLTGEIRSGQIGGVEGYDYCILKFGDPARTTAELEMTYYAMATASGIDMMPCRLLDVAGEKHFVTRRFDREEGRKLHMQTLAALYPEADSYEQLLMVCRKMRLPEQAQEEVFRRMVFNILANNTDDHNKNFSFLMDEQGRWRLAPAYDMTYIFDTGGFLPETRHCLSMCGKLSGHTLHDALDLARTCGIRRAPDIISRVADAIGGFRTLATRYGVGEVWMGAVESTLQANLQAWGLTSEPRARVDIEVGGTLYCDVHIERTYRGNFHLYATLGERVLRYVIGPSKAEYRLLEQVGPCRLSEARLRSLLERFLVSGKGGLGNL